MLSFFLVGVLLYVVVLHTRGYRKINDTANIMRQIMETRCASYDIKLKQIDEKLMMLNEQCSEIYNEI